MKARRTVPASPASIGQELHDTDSSAEVAAVALAVPPMLDEHLAAMRAHVAWLHRVCEAIEPVLADFLKIHAAAQPIVAELQKVRESLQPLAAYIRSLHAAMEPAEGDKATAAAAILSCLPQPAEGSR